MFARACAALTLMLVTAGPVAAQDDGLPRDFGDVRIDRDSVDLADVAGVAALLDLGLALELDSYDLDHLIHSVGGSRNPAYIPALKRQAEQWGYGFPWRQLTRTVSVLDGLWRLGEPEDYFYGLLPRWRESPTLAEAALIVVSRAPRAERLPEVETLAEEIESQIPQEWIGLLVWNEPLPSLANAARRYRWYFEHFAEVEASPVGDQLDFVLDFIENAVTSADINLDGDYILIAGSREEALPNVQWSGNRLRELARAYPTATAAALARLEDYGSFPDFLTPAQRTQAFAQLTDFVTVEVAALDTLPPAPPADPAAPVVPRELCAEPDSLVYDREADRMVLAETWKARFGYTNPTGTAVTIPLGAPNTLSPSQYDGQQPEVFDAAGETWVRFHPDAPVTWTLPGGSAMASASSLRCGDPPVPVVPQCDGTTATVYVAADGTITGGPDDGQPYTGTLRGTYQDDVIVGTDGPDTIEAGNGTDTVCGGAGDDTLSGDNGRDALFGGSGDDALFGGNGPDTLLGDAGQDSADGGRGPDTCDAETETSCERDPE